MRAFHTLLLDVTVGAALEQVPFQLQVVPRLKWIRPIQRIRAVGVARIHR
jgi:hypothetical protein